MWAPSVSLPPPWYALLPFFFFLSSPTASWGSLVPLLFFFLGNTFPMPVMALRFLRPFSLFSLVLSASLQGDRSVRREDPKRRHEPTDLWNRKERKRRGGTAGTKGPIAGPRRSGAQMADARGKVEKNTRVYRSRPPPANPPTRLFFPAAVVSLLSPIFCAAGPTRPTLCCGPIRPTRPVFLSLPFAVRAV